MKKNLVMLCTLVAISAVPLFGFKNVKDPVTNKKKEPIIYIQYYDNAGNKVDLSGHGVTSGNVTTFISYTFYPSGPEVTTGTVSGTFSSGCELDVEVTPTDYGERTYIGPATCQTDPF